MTVSVHTAEQSVAVDQRPCHHMLRALETIRRRRRLRLTKALQPRHPSPGRGSSAPDERDERLKLGTAEFGHVGRDRLVSEGWAFHKANGERDLCRNSVWFLSRSAT